VAPNLRLLLQPCRISAHPARRSLELIILVMPEKEYQQWNINEVS
jgi:hypothetical protein